MTRDPSNRPGFKTKQEVSEGACAADGATRQASKPGETQETEAVLLLRTAIAAGDASGVVVGNPFDRIRATFSPSRRTRQA